MYIKHWSKESENVLKQLTKSGRAYIINNPRLPREFGMKSKNIINQDMLDIATIRNKKERKTWFITPPGIEVIPKNGKHGINFHFKRYRF